MAKKALSLLLDFVKAAAVGIGTALVLGLLLAGIGFLFGGTGTALEVAKNGLLLVFSLLLFVVAGMLLIRGKKPENIRLGKDWHRHFSVIGTKTMLLALAAGIMIVITIVDSLQRAAK